MRMSSETKRVQPFQDSGMVGFSILFISNIFQQNIYKNPLVIVDFE